MTDEWYYLFAIVSSSGVDAAEGLMGAPLDAPRVPTAASAAERYPHVFQGIEIGGCAIRNRIYVSALTTNFAVDSAVTDRHVAFLAERSRGGVGLIVSEALEVHRSGLSGPGRLHVSDDGCISELQRMTAAVHEGGSRIFAQVTHSGYTLAWAPSARGVRPWDPVPHEMTRSEVEMLVDCFGNAATRVVASGFDGVQVHLGHGHLLHRFLSAGLNQRTDSYGGSYDNRLRLPLRVLAAVRAAVGPDFPVGIRISSDELTAIGPRLAEMQQIVTSILSAEQVQFVDISQSGAAHHGLQLPDMPHGPTPFLAHARSYAPILGRIPLMTACRFTALAEAEAALATGEVSMVGMSRAHIADPQIISNAVAGREDQTRPCVALNHCAAGTVRGEVLRCTVNPAVGHEGERVAPPQTADRHRRVLVIGGGPAGLEFATNAAARGSAVTVWERGTHLGGDLLIGARGFGRGDLGKLAAFYERELRRLGVAVELERPASADAVESAEWDLVVVATGAHSAAMTLEGWGPIAGAEEIMCDRLPAGRAVIIDFEGSWRAASAIETAANDHSVHVVLVTPHDRVLDRINSFSRDSFFYRTATQGIEIHVMSEPSVFKAPGTLTIRSRASRTDIDLVDVTSIHQVMPKVASEALAEDLRMRGLRTVTIGDARLAGDLLSAIHSGYGEAMRLDGNEWSAPSTAPTPLARPA